MALFCRRRMTTSGPAASCRPIDQAETFRAPVGEPDRRPPSSVIRQSLKPTGRETPWAPGSVAWKPCRRPLIPRCRRRRLVVALSAFVKLCRRPLPTFQDQLGFGSCQESVRPLGHPVAWSASWRSARRSLCCTSRSCTGQHPEQLVLPGMAIAPGAAPSEAALSESRFRRPQSSAA